MMIVKSAGIVSELYMAASILESLVHCRAK